MSLSVCPRAYLRNYKSSLYQIFVQLPARARSFSGGVAICHVLPVLWMTSCLHIMATRNMHGDKGPLRIRLYSQSDYSAERIWHRAVYSDWPTRGSTGQGAEADIYDSIAVSNGTDFTSFHRLVSSSLQLSGTSLRVSASLRSSLWHMRVRKR